MYTTKKIEVRPILKWAGGKSQLLPELQPRIPSGFNRYVEPFVGGGALFFALQPERAIISDGNPELINLYQCVANDVEEVIAILKRYVNTEEAFYQVRAQDWRTLPAPEAAARMIYLNRTCFNGLYRVNRRGEFNVPYGGIAYNSKLLNKKLQYYKSKELLSHFKRTKIFNLDFEQFLRTIKPKDNDFIFLDPPYDSEFSTYAQNAFTRDDQKRLADYLIYECNAKWMMIIKNTDFIYGLYDKEGVNIRTFDKEYVVSFMNRNDKKVTHLLITNY